MDRTERFYKIDQLLKDGKVVPFAGLKDALGVSRATLKRDLVYMRDRLHAPIEYVRAGNGYRFGKPRDGPRYELPGLWFNATEIYALLTTLQLLSNLQPGLLDGQVPALVEQARLQIAEELRSEEHTSELQSQSNLVCRLLLEKKKNTFSSSVHVGEPSFPRRGSSPCFMSRVSNAVPLGQSPEGRQAVVLIDIWAQHAVACVAR